MIAARSHANTVRVNLQRVIWSHISKWSHFQRSKSTVEQNILSLVTTAQNIQGLLSSCFSSSSSYLTRCLKLHLRARRQWRRARASWRTLRPERRSRDRRRGAAWSRTGRESRWQDRWVAWLLPWQPELSWKSFSF